MIIKTRNALQGIFTITADLKAEDIAVLKKALREYSGHGSNALNLLSDLTCAINDNHQLLVKMSKE